MAPNKSRGVSNGKAVPLRNQLGRLGNTVSSLTGSVVQHCPSAHFYEILVGKR